MPTTDPRIDAYIKKAAPFAQPILKHFRKLVHATCPDVQETIKWGFAFFDYKGPFCSMASFKEHCAIGFWKAEHMKEAKKMEANQGSSMGHLGRITSLRDLPEDRVIIDYLREAMLLNEQGVKRAPRKKIADPKSVKIPDYFLKALKLNETATAHFEAFSPGQKREYILWITEAKTEETRNKRMETAVEWISEGKIRNWKYLKKK